MSSSADLWAWRAQVEANGVASSRKNATIVMYNETHTAVARWSFVNAWPSKITGVSLNGRPPTEIATIVADSVRRVSP